MTELGRELRSVGFSLVFSALLSLQGDICGEEGTNSLPFIVNNNSFKKAGFQQLHTIPVCRYNNALVTCYLVPPADKQASPHYPHPQHHPPDATPSLAWQCARQDGHPGAYFTHGSELKKWFMNE